MWRGPGRRDILQKLRDLGLPHEDNLGRSIVTASAGVYAGVPQSSDSADVVVGHADQALYAAKNAGRDRVYCFDAGRQEAVPG
jgi:PleD family two-component response regulator